MIYSAALDAKFTNLVNRLSPERCWIWKGTFSGHNGIYYGTITHAGVNFKAHRLAWELANGRKIPDGLLVRHSCDNSMCCNPSHLDIGTVQDNADDKVKRGRQGRRGSRVASVDIRFRPCHV